LRYDFRPGGRRGAPAFAGDEFSEQRRPEPILYLGRMKPRALLSLRAPGNLAATPPAQRRLLRSKDRDITGLVSLVSAQHQSGNGATRSVAAGALPAIRVQYDPEMPETIEVPSTPGTCVLLIEVGEGNNNDWQPGLWTLKLRLDASSLNVRLAPFSSHGAPDPAAPETAVFFEMQFFAKRLAGPEDRANFAMFEYAEARTTLTGGPRALAALDQVVQDFPRDGNVRMARAELLHDQGRKTEAAAEAREVLRLTTNGALRSRLHTPGRQPMTRDQSAEWVKSKISAWENP
jgi:hypothetical protein